MVVSVASLCETYCASVDDPFLFSSVELGQSVNTFGYECTSC